MSTAPLTSDPLPESFRPLLERARPPLREAAERSLRALAGLGIDCYEELMVKLPDLGGDALGTAACALYLFGARRSVPPLLRLLRSPEPEVRALAIVGLETTRSLRAIPAFIRHLREDPDPLVRERAAHGLGFLFSSRVDEDRILEPLLASLQDEGETVPVRAQAAESIGNTLGCGADRRTRRFKRAQAALLPLLDHSSVEIRFWTCFALGTMRSRAAVPALERLAAEDDAVCPGWWAVKDEASDALQYIRTGSWPNEARLPSG